MRLATTMLGIALAALLALGCDSEQDAGNCPEGRIACDGSCIDPSRDPEHCGACRRACSHGVGCFAAECTSPGSLSQPRRAHALVRADDGRIYCIGGGYGVDAQIAELTSVEVYDPSTNRWTEIAPLSTPRFALSAALRGGKLIAFGGSPAWFASENPQDAVGTSEEYSPALDSWNAAGSLNVARADAASATDVGGRVWVFWGWGTQPNKVDTVEVCDDDGKWRLAETTVNPVRGPRSGASAVAFADGTIYLAGGVVEANLASPFVDVFRPQDASWSTAPDLPEHRYLGAAALLPDGRVLYAGGSDADPPATGTRDVFAYRPGDAEWHRLEPLPVGLWNPAAVTGLDGRVYVVGGTVNGSVAPLGQVFVYDPVRDTWYE